MEPTDRNRRAWDEMHRARDATAGLPPEVLARMPALGDKHVLQLGGDAAAAQALHELGALVTVVTSEPDTVENVRDLESGAAAVQADVTDLPLELRRGRFDLVYAVDVLPEVRDLSSFAGSAAAAARSAGLLVLQDAHPVAGCLDDTGLAWRGDYFEGRFQLGQIVDALTAAGFWLRSLDEFSSLHRWRMGNRRVPGDLLITALKE